MRHLSGAPLEVPQRTHRWNNHHLDEKAVAHLNTNWMVTHEGDRDARKLPRLARLTGLLAHLTKFGGWKHYLVLDPSVAPDWYVGWHWSGGAGVSRVSNKGPIRVLVGPGPTKWFGIEAVTNTQIPIKQIGRDISAITENSPKFPSFEAHWRFSGQTVYLSGRLIFNVCLKTTTNLVLKILPSGFLS